MSILASSQTMAKALRKVLGERQIDLSHGACLEIVARQFGFSNWNVLKAALDDEISPVITVFVEYGRQEEAALFYATAFGAVQRHVHSLASPLLTSVQQSPAGSMMAVEMDLCGLALTVCGSNPRREAEPSRGGPFFLKSAGGGSVVFRLEVNDVAAVTQRAVAAGASVRDRLQMSDTGQETASVIDPFGQIWGLSGKQTSALGRVA